MKPHFSLRPRLAAPGRRRRTLGLALSLVVVVALMLVGGAFGKPKPIVPKVGEYVGTAKGADGKTFPVTGKVAKESGKLVVYPIVSQTLTCENGTELPVNVGYATPLKGSTYSGTLKTRDPIAGEDTTHKMTIKFTSATAFSGTASEESPALTKEPGSGPCEAGPVSFKFHLK